MKKVKEENRKRYTADFETLVLSDEQIKKGARTYVWAAALCDCLNIENVQYATSIDAFFNDIVFKLSHCSTIYFHNEKFDGSFIVSYLLSKGYTQKHVKPYSLKDNEFAVIASGMGVFYSISICHNGNLYIINDSLKKLPFKVSEIAEKLGYEEGKGEINYTDYREEGGVLSDEDKDYIRRDVQIIAKALQDLYFSKGLYSITIGSDCMKMFKSTCRQFSNYFVKLDTKVDAFCRKAYTGGRTQLREGIADKLINKPGLVADVNSLYPYVMHSKSGYSYPVGQPVHYEGKYVDDVKHPLYIQHIRCAFDVKPNRLPTVQIKNSFFYRQNEFVKTTHGEIEDLYLTSVDLEIFLDNYNVYLYDEDDETIEYVDGYKFEAVTGLFDKYIDYWVEKKIEAGKNGDKVQRLLSKLFVNNLSGKFGQNPKSTSLQFNLTNDVLKRDPIDDEREAVYVPVACFITAYGRKELNKAIKANYHRFLYCDTDSIHLLGTELPEGIKIDDYELGAWAIETRFTACKFIRQKTYAECVNGTWQFKCAGLPNPNEVLTIDKFYAGSTIEACKKISKQVPGGIVLVPSDYHIKQH